MLQHLHVICLLVCQNIYIFAPVYPHVREHYVKFLLDFMVHFRRECNPRNLILVTSMY